MADPIVEAAHVSVVVNGRRREVAVAPHRTLLEALRTDMGLTGTKECCLVGECGACTVMLNGRSVDACLVLAVEADGGEVTTVEGLAIDGRPSALQAAFLAQGAAQCGFCIPGQLVSAHALLATNPHPTRDEIAEGLAGNLCRCAGYEQIMEAVADAAGRSEDASPLAPAAEKGALGEEAPHPDPASVPDAGLAPQ